MTPEELKNIIAEKVREIQGEDREALRAEVSASVKASIESAMKEQKLIPFTPPPEETMNPTGGFSCISEFAKAVALASPDMGGNVDKRLKNFDARNFKAAGDPTLEEGDPAAGGYLVPTEFRNQVLRREEAISPFVNQATIIPMQTSSIDIPYVNGFNEAGGVVDGGIQWLWTAEKAAHTAKRPDFGMVSLKLKTLVGLCYGTDQLLEDSPISMEGILMSGFANGLNNEKMRVFMHGSGAGQPRGITNDKALVVVAKEAAQKAATIKFENVIKMLAQFYGDSGVWIINRQCLPQLCSMSLVVGTGGVPVFMPANGVAGAMFPTLFGFPIQWAKHGKALGTQGDITLVDPSQYLVGQKAGAAGGVKTAVSIHLKFDYAQTAFRLIARMDGQGWWPQAFIGPESPDALSPFVQLATRA